LGPSSIGLTSLTVLSDFFSGRDFGNYFYSTFFSAGFSTFGSAGYSTLGSAGYSTFGSAGASIVESFSSVPRSSFWISGAFGLCATDILSSFFGSSLISHCFSVVPSSIGSEVLSTLGVSIDSFAGSLR